MEKQPLLYSMYFRAEDRFLNHPVLPGHEPDVIDVFYPFNITYYKSTIVLPSKDKIYEFSFPYRKRQHG